MLNFDISGRKLTISAKSQNTVWTKKFGSANKPMLLTQKDKSEDELTTDFGILTDKTCEICGTQMMVNLSRDKLYCLKCDKWIENE